MGLVWNEYYMLALLVTKTVYRSKAPFIKYLKATLLQILSWYVIDIAVNQEYKQFLLCY